MTETLTTAHAALLARNDVFARLDRVALARLAACAEPLTFGVADIVCREGDSADGLYVAVRGMFGIFVADPTSTHQARIGSIGPGEVLRADDLSPDQPRARTL